MALVMNASSIEVQVKVHGAYFTFKPKQIKNMHEDKVAHLISSCSYMGFVALPDSCEDPEFLASKKGQEIRKAAEETGINNRVAYLDQLRQNEVVSLQRDIDRSGMKYDARLDMDPKMLANLEELAKYKTAAKSSNAEKLEQIKKLEKMLEE